MRKPGVLQISEYTALRKEGRHLPFTPSYWFSLELVQALPGQWILLIPWNYLVLKQGRFSLAHLRSDCHSRVLLGKKGVSMCRQNRGRTGRQPSCSEAQKSTILGYTWKWCGSPYLTTSAWLCPSETLVRSSTEHKKKHYAKTRFQATCICTGERFCWHN